MKSSTPGSHTFGEGEGRLLLNSMSVSTVGSESMFLPPIRNFGEGCNYLIEEFETIWVALVGRFRREFLGVITCGFGDAEIDN
jgi:hypothetical protein